MAYIAYVAAQRCSDIRSKLKILVPCVKPLEAALLLHELGSKQQLSQLQ